MDEKDELIRRITGEIGGKSSRFSDNVYSDLPLLRRGSQIAPPATPQRIREMKNRAFSREAAWKTSAWLMYDQGVFMADFTDNSPYTEDFVKYYVTYDSLSTAQLRGYFTWRTSYRAGGGVDAPTPFLFLYAYELINNIGVISPDEGFARLKRFGEDCSLNHKVVSRSVSKWLMDYVIYYELDTANLRGLPEMTFDENVLTLMNWRERTEEELYSAMLSLSAYAAERSKFVASCPDDFRTAAVRLLAMLSEHHEKRCKNPLWTNLFGRVTEMNYRMFDDAVFYDRMSSRNADISVNEIHSYTCRNGEWRCRRIYGSRGKNGKLGDILKALDHIMRERYGFAYKLQMPDITKKTVEMINAVLDGMDEEKRLAKAAEITIDLSALSGIRAAAAETRDKLLTEEDMAYFDEPAPVEAPEQEPDSAPRGNGLLDPPELAFLRALLNGGDWSAEARKFGCIPSVLADSINEKLFDDIGDTVIEFINDTPQIVEDYLAEVRSLTEGGE